MAALDLYLEIEKVRFGDRLTIEKSIEAEAQQALVPSLILQPLIENAIKYAISPCEAGGTLRISARVQRATLVMQLSDTGPGLGSDNGSTKSQWRWTQEHPRAAAAALWRKSGVHARTKRTAGFENYDQHPI